jgi:unsaturated chondroitin disaccharide hydrolase
MKTLLPFALFLLLSFPFAASAQKNPDRVFALAEQQTRLMLAEIEKAKSSDQPDAFSPRSLTSSGELHLVPSRDWTSGFFPGVLWFLHEYSGKDEWMDQARTYTARLEKEKTNGGTHDMGFKIYSSYGAGYRLTGRPLYRDVIVESAKTLITRFNPTVGALRSWDHNTDKWGYPVIIDNLMNLELLFAATKLTGDSTFYQVAVSHANTTLKNHFRPDGSSFHVIDYDPATGQVRKRNTHQGASHESAWARGQAWGLYGYTMCFRETQNEAYLKQAEKIADFYLGHKNLPKDLVPYWDFNAAGIPNEPRDASAAAVVASALFELSEFSPNGKKYRRAADRMVESLSRAYTSPAGENKGFILLHSTGHKPNNSEVDVPINYADYYFLEALLRQKNRVAPVRKSERI